MLDESSNPKSSPIEENPASITVKLPSFHNKVYLRLTYNRERDTSSVDLEKLKDQTTQVTQSPEIELHHLTRDETLAGDGKWQYGQRRTMV